MMRYCFAQLADGILRGLDWLGTRSARCFARLRVLSREGWQNQLPVLGTLGLLILLAGCSSRISAERVPTRQAYSQLTRSALTDNGWSAETERVLHRYGLNDEFEKNPAAALRALHDRTVHDDRRDILFALSELSYVQGERLLRRVRLDQARQARDYHLASALYAWFFMFGDRATNAEPMLVRHTVFMAGIYNRAVAKGFLSDPGTNATVVPAAGARLTQPGTVAIGFDPAVHARKWDTFEKFLPADDYRVHGLSVRNVQEGLGAALIVVGRQSESSRSRPHVAGSLFLRVEGQLADWSAGRLRAGLEFYLASETNLVTVAGRQISLHTDLTAPLAYALNNSTLWSVGRAQFYSGKEQLKSGIQRHDAHRPGKMPVVFVHGTWSSPIRWAEMWNSLISDPVLRERYQFWTFNYSSGNPVSYSALKLREAIAATVKELDPEGRDAALRQMVIIGHSQGGLLTKLTAVDTGDKLWRAATGKGMERLDALPPKKRAALEQHFVFTPEPHVRRVVFISTPHRGSYLAFGLAQRLFARLVTLPKDLVDLSATLVTLGQTLDSEDGAKAPLSVRRRIPTSIDSMSQKSPYLLALAEIPTVPNITAHSIISIKGDARPPAGRDGLVKYTSAHQDCAVSECIVRSKHSCLEQPTTIEEVRRILFEHLESVKTAASVPQTPAQVER